MLDQDRAKNDPEYARKALLSYYMLGSAFRANLEKPSKIQKIKQRFSRMVRRIIR